MIDASARPTMLDVLKDAFLRNAIRTDDRAFDLRETILVDEADETVVRLTDKMKPAESRA